MSWGLKLEVVNVDRYGNQPEWTPVYVSWREIVAIKPRPATVSIHADVTLRSGIVYPVRQTVEILLQYLEHCIYGPH